jgi:hypothetical protein
MQQLVAFQDERRITGDRRFSGNDGISGCDSAFCAAMHNPAEQWRRSRL